MSGLVIAGAVAVVVLIGYLVYRNKKNKAPDVVRQGTPVDPNPED